MSFGIRVLFYPTADLGDSLQVLGETKNPGPLVLEG